MEKPTEKPSDDFRYIVRISNADLDGNKKIVDSLRKIKGIGFNFANAVCAKAQVDKNSKTGYLKDDDLKKLENVINNASSNLPIWLLNRRRNSEDDKPAHFVTTDLSFGQENDVRQMKRIKSYRGIRHMSAAPLRGQRTRSNFRRNKGKVMGVAKSKTGKPAAEKKK